MSTVLVQCKNCEYCDCNERDSYKCYCDWYRTYEDPDEWRECDHFRD